MSVAVFLVRFRKPLLRSPPLSTLYLHSLSPQNPTAISSPTLQLDDPAIARSNALISRLASEGNISSARRLFDQTPNADLIAWSSLISAYARRGHLLEARRLFDRPDAKKNVVTSTALLFSYLRSNLICDAERLFADIPDKNLVTYNTMLEGYVKNRLFDRACHLFDEMPMRNVVSWNTLLSGLSRAGRMDEAYGLFCRMGERDVISWTSMISALAQSGAVDRARELFERMPERNVVSWNAMITGYMRNQRVEEAVELFGRMPERDITSWNAMITGLIQTGRLERARELFDEIGERNVVTWTTLIEGYMQAGQCESGVELFTEMLMDGVKPNEGSFVSVLGGISDLAALPEGQQVHQIICKSPFQFNHFVGSALINMYAKCGNIGLSGNVFELSKDKDLVSWNAMIAAFAHHGLGRDAIRSFEEMQRSGLKPNDVTYVGLLSACSHSGLVNEGLEFFRSMVRDGSVEVREAHYACFVDLCGRAGQLEEARHFIGRMKNKSASLWRALLGGCNNHGNLKIGDVAAKALLEAEPDSAGTYILLSNMNASAGRWEEAKKIRLKMKHRGLKKQPGCSWIEVGNRVHVFVVRDHSHREKDLVFRVVKDLHYKMRITGFMHSLDDVDIMAV